MPDPLRPRVCLDYRPALHGRGGIARATAELARGLERLDSVDLRLFGHSFSRVDPRRQRLATKVHRWPVPGRSLPWLGRMGLGADRLVGGADVVHWTDYIHPHPGRAAVVLTVHDLAFVHDPGYHGAAQAELLLRRTRTAAARAEAVVVPSAATAADVREHLGVTAEVIPFGGDHGPLDPFAPRTAIAAGDVPPLPPPYFVMLGTVEPRKNHHRMLQAWRTLPPPRPPLVVVGAAGWECDAIAAALRDAAADGVRWLPRATDDEVTRLLHHATAMLYPSLLEGFGFPPLEAMGLGVPTLCGDTPALRELAGDAALFANPGDVDDLARAVKRLLGDGELRADLRQRGPARAQRFTWGRCAAAHVRLYRRVAAGACT